MRLELGLLSRFIDPEVWPGLLLVLICFCLILFLESSQIMQKRDRGNDMLPGGKNRSTQIPSTVARREGSESNIDDWSQWKSQRLQLTSNGKA